MRRPRAGASAWALALALSGCASFESWDSRLSGRLSDETVLRHASSGWLGVERARLITGNDEAFRSKLQMIEAARETIDAAYYIYSDDYSTAVLSRALVAAARRGVRVRLLLDYHSNYKHLDQFSLLERLGSAEGGRNLEVRFYNRPTPEVIKDAAYLGMGCPRDVDRSRVSACSEAKFAAIERRFEEEQIDGQPARELGFSNLNVGNSGLFLSGLYGKSPDAMTLAVLEGQQIDVSSLASGGESAGDEQRAALLRLARLYWVSRTGNAFERLSSRLQLGIAFALFGEQLDPVREAFASHLPAERDAAAEALRDWEYVTDFTHHKLLLVDGSTVQLGGRNVEDSYHMRPAPLVQKYVFMDTDLRADLSGGGEAIVRSFDALWDFRRMVASIAEVRRHAPNDFVANAETREAAEALCAHAPEAEREACREREYAARALDLAAREEAHWLAIQQKAAAYEVEYPYAAAPETEPAFEIDPGAQIAYVENLPFRGGPGARGSRRSYGAENGREAQHGKRIHALWLASLENVCREATAERPRRVILHNAYFFPPANLMGMFGRMVSGELDCAHVTVSVLTNSIETTDLNVVNLLARHSAKAFAEFASEGRHPERGARFEYFEYLPRAGEDRVSLHTKVSVLGDDVLVGSANADVRSYMMDSNNGMFVRGAPEFTARYRAHLERMMADPSRTRDLTAYFASTPRDEMLREDLATLREILAKYRAERWVDAERQALLEDAVTSTLDRVYSLSLRALDGDREAQAEFDRIFKLI